MGNLAEGLNSSVVQAFNDAVDRLASIKQSVDMAKGGLQQVGQTGADEMTASLTLGVPQRGGRDGGIV